jgi:urea carboxylase-associated protein 2
LDTPVLTSLLTEDLPGGVAWSKVLHRNTILRLTALADGANVSTLLYAAGSPLERLNVPDTLKAQMSARVTPPMVLMSDMGRALVTVVGSSLDWHDVLTGHGLDSHVERRCGPSSYGADRNAWRRSARHGLLDELAKHDLGERDLHACVNFFSKVAIEDGSAALSWTEGHAAEGDWVDLRADQDTLVVLTSVPHPLDPATSWAPSPVRVEIRATDPPGPDDPARAFRAESGRALDETLRSLA